MAGMLPGVECARRRRLHQSGGCSNSSAMATHNSTRRSFSLYSTSNLESLLSSSSLLQGSILNQAYPDEELGEAAREAKRRLDEKFRIGAQRKSEDQRNNQKRKKLFSWFMPATQILVNLGEESQISK